MTAPRKLVLATQNPNKVHELTSMLMPYHILPVPLRDFTDIEVPETGRTLRENAKLKADFAFGVTGLPSIADDSGLMLKGLDNRPGIATARFAQNFSNYHEAMAALYQELAEKGASPDAFFSCIIALRTKSDTYFFEGIVKGHVVWPPRGNKAFAFGPFFQPNGFPQTFGEMDPEEKNKISHRGIAIHKLSSFLVEHDVF